MAEDMAGPTRAQSSPPPSVVAPYQQDDAISRAFAEPWSLVIFHHDHTIKCACPSGTERHGRDFMKVREGDHFIWVHMPCEPFWAEMSEAAALRFRTILYRTEVAAENPDDMHVLTEKMLTISLNPDPSPRQLKQIRNAISSFHCDGECRGSTDHADYFWCHICFSWQHKPCMLFGDAGDKGRPICNPCYMDFMIHEEEYAAWQKKRVAQAALEALTFIRDEKNHDKNDTLKVKQMSYATKFLAKMLFKNRGAFYNFVINRRRVVRWIKARRGLPQPVYTRNTLALPARDSTNAVASAPFAGPSKRVRKRRPNKSEAAAAVATDELFNRVLAVDDEDEDEDHEDDEDDASSGGNIVIGKAAALPQRTKSPFIAPNMARARPTPANVPIEDLTASDDERNKRMERAAALKARKKMTVSGDTSSQAIEVEDEAPPTKKVKRTSRLARATDDAGEDYGDIGVPPAQVQRNLAQSNNNRFQHARKSALSTGQRRVANGHSGGNEEDAAESATMPPPRKKAKGKQVAFAEDVEMEDITRRRNHPTQSQAPKIHCGCGLVTSIVDCFECRTCDFFQHIACAPGISKESTLCGACVDTGSSAASLPLPTPIVPTVDQRSAGAHEEVPQTPDLATLDTTVRFDTASLASSAFPPGTAPAPTATVPAELAPPPGVLLSGQRAGFNHTMPAAAMTPPTTAAQLSSTGRPLGQIPGKAEALPGQLAAQAQGAPLDQHMQQEVRTLCSTILWDAYCNLPDANAPEVGLNRLKTQPPPDWLAEAARCLTLMFEACGSAKIAEYLQPVFQQWPRNSVNVMKALREFGAWARIKGPFKKSRKELGLLEEILGFADKGKYHVVPKVEEE